MATTPGAVDASFVLDAHKLAEHLRRERRFETPRAESWSTATMCVARFRFGRHVLLEDFVQVRCTSKKNPNAFRARGRTAFHEKPRDEVLRGSNPSEAAFQSQNAIARELSKRKFK